MAAGLVAAMLAASCSSSGSAEDQVAPSGSDEPTTTSIETATSEGPTTTTTEATTTTTASLASGPSAGCTAPGVAPDDAIVTADGETRTFSLELPDNYDPTVPAPLVFDFHGLGSDGLQQSLVSLSPVVAGSRGYISVVPDGSNQNPAGARLWNLLAEPLVSADPSIGELAPDDVAFVTELLDAIEASVCVDTGRVHAMGFSNGGFFSALLACEMSDRIASVVTVAGIIRPADCDPIRPVPIVHFHGTADQVVPFDGQDSILTADPEASGGLDPAVVEVFEMALFRPIDDQVADWVDGNSCAAEPRVDSIGTAVERRQFEDCDADVVYYVIADGGHTWPGSFATAVVSSLGSTTFDVIATEVGFDFFATHPMPGSG